MNHHTMKTNETDTTTATAAQSTKSTVLLSIDCRYLIEKCANIPVENCATIDKYNDLCIIQMQR